MKQRDQQYDVDNLAAARRALAQPERFPHLVEWAAMVLKRPGNVAEIPAARVAPETRGQGRLFGEMAS